MTLGKRRAVDRLDSSGVMSHKEIKMADDTVTSSTMCYRENKMTDIVPSSTSCKMECGTKTTLARQWNWDIRDPGLPEIPEGDPFEAWPEGPCKRAYCTKTSQEASRHASGWAMRNTNNHNVNILKKSCLGVLVCDRLCAGMTGQGAGSRTSGGTQGSGSRSSGGVGRSEPVYWRPAICDKARSKQIGQPCRTPGCPGTLQLQRCQGRNGYPVTHFWRNDGTDRVFFQSKGTHNHPRPVKYHPGARAVRAAAGEGGKQESPRARRVAKERKSRQKIANDNSGECKIYPVYPSPVRDHPAVKLEAPCCYPGEQAFDWLAGESRLAEKDTGHTFYISQQFRNEEEQFQQQMQQPRWQPFFGTSGKVKKGLAEEAEEMSGFKALGSMPTPPMNVCQHEINQPIRSPDLFENKPILMSSVNDYFEPFSPNDSRSNSILDDNLYYNDSVQVNQGYSDREQSKMVADYSQFKMAAMYEDEWAGLRAGVSQFDYSAGGYITPPSTSCSESSPSPSHFSSTEQPIRGKSGSASSTDEPITGGVLSSYSADANRQTEYLLNADNHFYSTVNQNLSFFSDISNNHSSIDQAGISGLQYPENHFPGSPFYSPLTPENLTSSTQFTKCPPSVSPYGSPMLRENPSSPYQYTTLVDHQFPRVPASPESESLCVTGSQESRVSEFVELAKYSALSSCCSGPDSQSNYKYPLQQQQHQQPQPLFWQYGQLRQLQQHRQHQPQQEQQQQHQLDSLDCVLQDLGIEV